MQSKKREEEIESFFKELEEQPGVKEAAEAYGRYEELLLISNAYLKIMLPRSRQSVSNNTHEK